MVRERIAMRDIKQILKLHFESGMSGNTISQTVGVSRPIVHKCVKAAIALGITSVEIEQLSNSDLEQRLQLYKPVAPERPSDSELNFEIIHRELKRRDVKVTLELLWQEYKRNEPEGISYGHYTKLYRNWKRSINLTMRQEHIAGDKLFVDFAGKTKNVIDRSTGEVRPVYFFVATLGASNYSFVYPCFGQDIRSWLQCHIKALEFFGGVPNCIVPDNLKSGVIQHIRFAPKLNRAYRSLAEHYNFVIMPARPYHPQDKAKVEACVGLIETWILGVLRDLEFYSLDELKVEVDRLVTAVNEKPFKKLSGNRRTWFEALDKPALKALPAVPFEHEQWLVDVPVPRTYHIEIDRHHYSVPHSLVGQAVDARITDTTVEILHDDRRVASHPRSFAEGKATSIAAHMPKYHREYAGRTPEKFIAEAEAVGSATATTVKAILASKPYPQLSFDQCFGLLHYLRNKYSAEQLEAACLLALQLRQPTYRLVKELLKIGLKNIPTQLCLELSTNHIEHENIRGPNYYQKGEQQC